MRSIPFSSVRLVTAAALAAAASATLWPGLAAPAMAQSSPSCRPVDTFNAVTALDGDVVRVTATNPYAKVITVQLSLLGADGNVLEATNVALPSGHTTSLAAAVGSDVPGGEAIYGEGQTEWPIYGRTLRAVVAIASGAPSSCTTPISGVEVLSPSAGTTRLTQQDVVWPIYG